MLATEGKTLFACLTSVLAENVVGTCHVKFIVCLSKNLMISATLVGNVAMHSNKHSMNWISRLVVPQSHV